MNEQFENGKIFAQSCLSKSCKIELPSDIIIRIIHTCAKSFPSLTLESRHRYLIETNQPEIKKIDLMFEFANTYHIRNTMGIAYHKGNFIDEKRPKDDHTFLISRLPFEKKPTNHVYLLMDGYAVKVQYLAKPEYNCSCLDCQTDEDVASDVGSETDYDSDSD